MENTQYLKYKDSFKKQCIFSTIGGGLAIIAVIFLLFIPIFQIRLGKLVLIEFSLFDELKALFSGSDGYRFIGIGIFQAFALVMFSIAFGMYIYELIKNITGITNLDNYALLQYDKIKTRGNERARRFVYGYTSVNCFMSGIIFEMLYIIFLKTFADSEYGDTYLTLMNGVSWKIVFTVVFAVAAIVMYIIRRVSYNQTRVAILKEDYGLSQTNQNN